MSSAKQTKQKTPAELATDEFFSRIKASIVFGFVVGVPAGAIYGVNRSIKLRLPKAELFKYGRNGCLIGGVSLSLFLVAGVTYGNYESLTSRSHLE